MGHRIDCRSLFLHGRKVIPWTAPQILSFWGRRRVILLARFLVLSSSILLMLPGAVGHSVTVVELAHLPAGLAIWQRQSVGIYRVCGPLSKLLYSLPSHLAGIRVNYPPLFDTDVRDRREWELGRLFQSQNRRRYHDVYRWTRLLPVLVTLVGGCLVCEWSTRLFGAWPGIASLGIWCWMPPVLAHGSLVTSDMPAAVTFLFALRCLWGFLREPRTNLALLVGFSLGLAVATKFSLVVLYPFCVLLIVARALNGDGLRLTTAVSQVSRWRLLGFGLLAILGSIVVIDTLYLYKSVGFRLSQWDHGESSLFRALELIKRGRARAWISEVPLPIPLEFVRGIDFQVGDAERIQSAYLLGRTRSGGWWYWYAVAAMLKVPVPVLLLFALSFITRPSMFEGRRPTVLSAQCLLIPAGFLIIAISGITGTGTNAAFRYILPILAPLCVWTGRVFAFQSRVAQCAVMALFVWIVANAVTAVPDHIGWENEFGRWCSREQPSLLGDCLDWGQDLARLRSWMLQRPGRLSTIVCAYGLGDGVPYGLVPPTAVSSSVSWDQASYLAVSENIIFGYYGRCVDIAGDRCTLRDDQRTLLLRRRPIDRVGRTIRIYQLSDVTPDRLVQIRGGNPFRR